MLDQALSTDEPLSILELPGPGKEHSRYERLVARQARIARTSKSDPVARYVVEKSLERC